MKQRKGGGRGWAGENSRSLSKNSEVGLREFLRISSQRIAGGKLDVKLNYCWVLFQVSSAVSHGETVRLTIAPISCRVPSKSFADPTSV